jgi:hypothetical protein
MFNLTDLVRFFQRRVRHAVFFAAFVALKTQTANIGPEWTVSFWDMDQPGGLNRPQNRPSQLPGSRVYRVKPGP